MDDRRLEAPPVETLFRRRELREVEATRQY